MPSQRDLLADQLTATLAFARSRFQTALIVHDEVKLEDVPAGQLFTETDGRWFMKGESLPGSLSIKAIAVDKEHLLLETSPLDPVGVETVINMRVLPLTLSDDAVVDTTTCKKIITITRGELQGDERELAPRVLWTIPWSALDDRRMEIVVEFADTLYSVDGFLADDASDAPEEASPAARPARMGMGMQMVQQMSFMQQLELEQRPILSARAEMRAEMEQRLELRQLMGLTQRLLAMDDAELVAWAQKNVATRGASATLRTFHFAITGQVKKAQPSLTWREARAITWTLINRNSGR